MVFTGRFHKFVTVFKIFALVLKKVLKKSAETDTQNHSL
jgi:hypothetical protein